MTTRARESATPPADDPPPVPPAQPARLNFAVRTLGSSIHVRQDKGTTWLAILCGALVAALCGVLAFGHFARTETVRGFASATSGLSRLDAQASGIVSQIHVRQGGLVKAGQPIVTLQVREVTSKGVSVVGAAASSLRQRRTNLLSERTRAREFLAESAGDGSRLDAMIASVIKASDQNEADIRRVQRRQADMVQQLNTYLKAGYATRDAVNAAERQAFDYQRQLSEVAVRRAELQQQRIERARARQQDVLDKQSRLSAIDSELAQIDAQLTTAQAQSQIDVVSPVDGQVATLVGEVGTSVLVDQTVAIVGDPKADPVVVLEVPSRAIGLAKVGQRVVLKYDAFPFKTFGVGYGTITAIASSPMKTPVGASEREGMADARPAAQVAQSVYRVEVKPESRTIHAYGTDETIAIGSTLSADIVIERRRLIDWVLDPIRAMRGRG